MVMVFCKGDAMRSKTFFVLLAGFFCFHGFLAAQIMVVANPVLNVWRKPGTINENPHGSTSLATQLLYGERFQLISYDQNGWAKIKVLEQTTYSQKLEWDSLEGWVDQTLICVPYDGDEAAGRARLIIKKQWGPVTDQPNATSVLRISLSIGSALQGIRHNADWWNVILLDGSCGFIPAQDVFEISSSASRADSLNMNFNFKPDDLRFQIVSAAQSFLPGPFCCGGRSAFNANLYNSASGIECSSLVNLAFRACGLSIPRYAHDLFLKARSISPQELNPGDLVFVKYQRDDFRRVAHVMMYLGGGYLLEATRVRGIHSGIRIVSFADKFGVELDKVSNGMRVGPFDGGIRYWDRAVYFGSFLNDPLTILQLQSNMFNGGTGTTQTRLVTQAP